MYINHAIYKTQFHKQIRKQSVSERVKTYFKDLYARYQSYLNMDLSQSVLDYNEMGKMLLSEIKKNGDLENVDTFFFPSWAISWNMEYSVPELHWKNVFDIHAPFYDVRDCGSLCVFSALNVALTLYQSQSINHSLCCTVENAYLKHEEEALYAPEANYIGSLYLSREMRSENPVEMMLSQVFRKTIIDSKEILLQIIQNYLAQYNIPSNQYVVCIRKNNIDFSEKKYFSIGYPISSGFLYYCIFHLFKNSRQHDFKYVFIVDEDVSHLSIGVALLKIN